MDNKLILVILHGTDSRALMDALLAEDLRVTHLSSMGGFFRRKSTTLLIGLPEEKTEQTLALVRQHCPTEQDADEHSATIFVLKAGAFVAI